MIPPFATFTENVRNMLLTSLEKKAPPFLYHSLISPSFSHVMGPMVMLGTLVSTKLHPFPRPRPRPPPATRPHSASPPLPKTSHPIPAVQG